MAQQNAGLRVPGALTAGVEAIERASELLCNLEAHSAGWRSATAQLNKASKAPARPSLDIPGRPSSLGGGPFAKQHAARRDQADGGRAASGRAATGSPSKGARSEKEAAARAAAAVERTEGLRLGRRDGGRLDAVAAAVADRMVLEQLEEHTAGLLHACTTSFAQLLELTQSVSAVAAASEAAAGLELAVEPEVEDSALRAAARVVSAEAAPMLLDDRIRSVRRSKALLDAQHNVLTQMLLQRAELERARDWRAHTQGWRGSTKMPS